MRASRIVAVVGLALAAVGATAQPCWACTCATATPRQHARSADVVFTGRVVKIVRPAPDSAIGDDLVRVRFDVGRTYKGRPRAAGLIRTNESGTACGFRFRRGKRYTVFAYRHKGRLETNICTGTKRGRINPDRYGFDRPARPSATETIHLS